MNCRTYSVWIPIKVESRSTIDTGLITIVIPESTTTSQSTNVVIEIICRESGSVVISKEIARISGVTSHGELEQVGSIRHLEMIVFGPEPGSVEGLEVQVEGAVVADGEWMQPVQPDPETCSTIRESVSEGFAKFGWRKLRWHRSSRSSVQVSGTLLRKQMKPVQWMFELHPVQWCVLH